MINLFSESVPAQRAGGVVAGGEPLVQARRVELLLASPAGRKKKIGFSYHVTEPWPGTTYVHAQVDH